MCWYGTIYCATSDSIHQAPIDSPRLGIYILVSGGLGGVLLPLLDDHGLEVLALGHLGLDLCDELSEVWCVLLHCQHLVFGFEVISLHPRA